MRKKPTVPSCSSRRTEKRGRDSQHTSYRKVWDAHGAISSCKSGFTRGTSTAEPAMKLCVCIDQTFRRNKTPLNRGDLSKAFDIPERGMKGIALRISTGSPKVCNELPCISGRRGRG